MTQFLGCERWWSSAARQQFERHLRKRETDRRDDVMDVLRPRPDRSVELVAREFGKSAHIERARQLDQQREGVQWANAGLDLLEPVGASPDESGQNRTRHAPRLA